MAKAYPEADLLAQVMVKARGKAALVLEVDPRRKARVKVKEILKRNLVHSSLRAFAIEVINVGIYTTLAMFSEPCWSYGRLPQA